MWPLKAHYGLWFGSLSGILPYVPVFAKNHTGVSATTVGALYFVLPFVVSVLKPLACSTADHYSKHSQALLISQLGTILGYGLLIAIPFLSMVFPRLLLFYVFCLFALIANTSMGVGISLTDYLVMHEVDQIKQRGGDTNYGNFRIWGTIGFGVFGSLSGFINEYFQDTMYLLPGLFMFVVIEAIDIFFIYKFYYLPKAYETNQLCIEAQANQNDADENRKATSSKSAQIIQPVSLRLKIRLLRIGNAIASVFRQIVNIYWHYPTLIQYTFTIFCFGILTAFHWSFFFWFVEEIRDKDTLLLGLCIAVESFVGEIPIFLIAHKIIAWVGPVFSLCISLAAFGVRFLCYGLLLSVQKKGGSYWDILLIETLQGLTFSLFYTVMTHVAQVYADKCDQIYSQVQPFEAHASLKAQSLPSLASSVDDRVEDENESNMIHDSRMNTLQSSNLVATDSGTSNKPSATMQSLLSACYEGVGLGVGSLIGGRLIDHVGFFVFWQIAGYLSLALVAFNLIIEAIKWIYAIKKTKSNTLVSQAVDLPIA